MDMIPDPVDPRDVEILTSSHEVRWYEERVERAARALLVLYFKRRGEGYDELLATLASEYRVDADHILDANSLGVAARSFGDWR